MVCAAWIQMTVKTNSFIDSMNSIQNKDTINQTLPFFIYKIRKMEDDDVKTFYLWF